MTRITENTIESFAIELLESLGYEYIYAPDIAPDEKTPERESYEQVLLIERLQYCKTDSQTVPADAS